MSKWVGRNWFCGVICTTPGAIFLWDGFSIELSQNLFFGHCKRFFSDLISFADFPFPSRKCLIIFNIFTVFSFSIPAILKFPSCKVYGKLKKKRHRSVTLIAWQLKILETLFLNETLRKLIEEVKKIERTNEQTNKRTYEHTNKRTNEQTNKRTNEQTNKQTKRTW